MKRTRRLAGILCIATASAAVPFTLTSPLHAASVNWVSNAGGNWTTAANWSSNPQLPGFFDDVTIDIPGGDFLVSLSNGTQSIHSLTTFDPLSLTGGSLTVGATMQINSSFTLGGGTLLNSAPSIGAGGSFHATSAGGTLTGVTLTGDLLADTNFAIATLTGSTNFTAARLSANGTALNMAPGYTLNSLVVSEGSSTGTRNLFLASGGAGTNTFGPAAIVRLASTSGDDFAFYNSSSANLVNNGLITAEAPSHTLSINNSSLTNNGTLQVLAGNLTVNTLWTNNGTISGSAGTFNIGGNFTTSAGSGSCLTSALTVNITGTIQNAGNTLALNTTTGSWNLAGGTINGGSILETGGASLRATTAGGTLANVAVTGDLNMNVTSANIIVNGTTSFIAARLTANGAAIGMGPGYTLTSLVVSEGAAIGTRNIFLASGGTGTITFGPAATVRLASTSGDNFAIYDSSTATLINNGLITAEAPARTLSINNAALTNNGTLQVLAGVMTVNTNWTNAGTISGSGGIFNIGGTFTNSAGSGSCLTSALIVNITGSILNTGGTLNFNATTGSWNLVGGTITNGFIIENGASVLHPTTAGGTLASVAFTGDLNMSTTNATATLTGNTSFAVAHLTAGGASLSMAPGYTLNSLVVSEGVTVGARALFLASGGTGTITFGPAAIARLASTSADDFAIYNSSSATLLNNGLITAEAAGRTLSINNTTLTSNGTIQALTGSTLIVSASTASIAGTLQALGGSLNFVGASLTITAPLTLTGGNATFNASSQSAAAISGSGSLTLSDAKTLTSDRVNLVGTWTIGGTQIIRPNASLTNRTNTTTTLSLSGSPGGWLSKLDLNNSNLIITNGANAQGQIKQQAHLGSWNGTGGGITSTSALAAATTSTATALAYATGTQFTASNGQTRFDSLPFLPTDTLVMYTLAGDANMDKSVTFADFLQLQNHYNQPTTDWQGGDFNYDTSTTFADFLILQNNYNKTLQPGSLLPAAGGSSSVPEPSSLLFLLPLIGSLRHRTSRRNRAPTR